MSSEKQPSPRAEPKFAFGETEVERARRAELAAKRAAAQLSLDAAKKKARPEGESQGFDPYNTSGSFDRKKHWERVGKR